MNILMITGDSNVLREGTAARARIEEYAGLTKRLIVIVLNTTRDRHFAVKVSDALWILPTNSYLRSFAFLTAVRIARQELFFQGRLQVDLVAADDASASALAGSIIRLLYRRPLHIRLSEDIFAPHTFNASFRTMFRSFLGHFLVRGAAGIIATSEAIRARLADISVAVADRTTVIPPYIDVPAYMREPVHVNLAAKYPQFKFILLVVAPLVAGQNIQLAISTLKGVHGFYPHAGLIIVGAGRQKRRLRSFAKRAGLSDRVIFENWTPNINSYYKTAHVFLVTSPYEEYGQTISEAAACSCAIVTTGVGIAPAIIENEKSGFICEPSDSGCFIRSVMVMIQDPHLRERIKVNVAQFLEHYVGANKEESHKRYKESWEKAIAMKE